MHPARFINFSTKQSRELVRKILAPHPHLGLRVQDLFKDIHKQFPGAKELPSYIPEIKSEVSEALKKLGMMPEYPEHPVRSMKHLKKGIIPDMSKRGEIHEVLIRKDTNGSDAVKFKLPHPQKSVNEVLPEKVLGMGVQAEWRWRLTPGHVPVDTPDPDWDEVRQEREAWNRGAMMKERAKQKRRALRHRM